MLCGSSFLVAYNSKKKFTRELETHENSFFF